MREEKIAVIGSGLVGSLWALMLAQKGKSVSVYERRGDIRSANLYQGRSINLALSERGLKALQTVGMEEEVRKLCIPMYGREVHDVQGNTYFMQYGKDGEAINSVSRGELNKLLLSQAGNYPNISLYFNQRCEQVDFQNGKAMFVDSETKQENTAQFDVMFGTDGAFSAVRQSLMKTEMVDFRYNQDYLAHGYKELTLHPTSDGGWKLKKEALHIWPRKSFMIIALPNPDGSFTCTLFLARNGEVSFDNLQTKTQITSFFEQYFADLIPLMPDYLEQFESNPVSALATIKLSPWKYQDKALLIGDAAHPIVPFYGQGMNAGFEDCTYLNQLTDIHQENWDIVFKEFEALRKKEGDAVGDLALKNFIEMRDLVADARFILKNKVDKKLEAYFPDKWVTQYRMVTFTHTPYSEALRLGYIHDAILERIVSNHPEIETELETERGKEILSGYVL